MKRQSVQGTEGFSLVEVTLALGLTAFCLLALLGLVPVGLDSMRDSNDESGATTCLEQVSSSIREAMPSLADPAKYQALGAYGTLSWNLAGGDAKFDLENLSSSGFPTTGTDGQKFSAHIVIHPPASRLIPGTALISVAWPGRAKWDESKAAWQNAQGAVYGCVVFLPES